MLGHDIRVLAREHGDRSGEVLGRDMTWCRGALAVAQAIMAETQPE